MRAIVIALLALTWLSAVVPAVAQDRDQDQEQVQNQQQTRPTSAQPATTSTPPRVFELPWDIRRDLPELKLTVRHVSDNPEERFAKINGERYEEGDRIEGVQIKAIRSDGVVCEFSGYEFIII